MEKIHSNYNNHSNLSIEGKLTGINLDKDNILINIAEIIRKEMSKAHIENWDAYLLDEEVFGLYFRKNIQELQTSIHNASYFLRVLMPKDNDKIGVGVVHINSITSDSIQDAIQNAKAIANIYSEPKFDLVSPGLSYASPITLDKEVWEKPEQILFDQGSILQQYLTDIVNAQTAFGKFRVYRTQKMLINSKDLQLKKRSTYFCYEFSFMAKKNGKTAEYWPKGYIKLLNQLNFQDRISEWVTYARDALKAKIPPAQKNIDVIFPPHLVRTALLTTLGEAFTGQAKFEKTSPFELKDKAADERVNLYDDGLLEGGLNTSGWDSEGTPKRKTTMIENGIVKNFLFDQKFASLMKTKPTGNAQRKPERGGIMQIEINNLVMDEGTCSLQDIVRDTKFGIYINDFSWLKPNPLTGIFGAEIRNGYLIENGEITKPIRGGNLSGNVYSMMKSISAISKERRFVMNSLLPFIKFTNLDLSS